MLKDTLYIDYVLVPHALDSKLTINNLQFVPEYAMKNSSEFKELAEVLEKELKMALLQDLDTSNANFEIKIMEFR